LNVPQRDEERPSIQPSANLLDRALGITNPRSYYRSIDRRIPMDTSYPTEIRQDILRGVRVAITGGTSGLGLTLVRECSARGAIVAFVARTRERVERVVREIAGSHGIVGDVAKKEDIHPI